MRSRTKQKLILLGFIFAVLASGVGGAIAYKNYKAKARAEAWFKEGNLAAEKGDYVTAIEKLRPYVVGNPNDLATLEKFSALRQKVKTPEHAEITETMWALKILVKARPEDIKSRRMLAGIFFDLQYDTEAEQQHTIIAEKTNWTDVDAMRKLSTSLGRLKKWQRCLEVTEKITAIAPTDLPAQIQRLGVMKQLDKPQAVIIKLAEQLRVDPKNRLKDGSPDPRFMLLKAISLDISGLVRDPDPGIDGQESRTAIEWYKEAAKSTPPDTQFSIILIEHLNRRELYLDALHVLRRLADVADSGEEKLIAPKVELAHRLWELRAWPELITRTETLTGKPEYDIELLAMRALALFATGKKEAGNALQTQLSRMNNDPVAAAWAMIVAEQSQPGTQVPKSLQETILKVPNRDAYLEFFLGDAYGRMGELQIAIKQWMNAANSTSTWSVPFETLANAYLSTGKVDVAVLMANIASRRGVDENGNLSMSTLLTLIRAYTAQLEALPESKIITQLEIDLLKLIEDVQKQSPGEPFSLPIQVALLAKKAKLEPEPASTKDRNAAIAIINSALTPNSKLTEDCLLRLAIVSKGYNLGLDLPLLERSEQLYGGGPSLAIVRAGAMMQNGKVAEAIATAKASADKALSTKPEPKESTKLEWGIAMARILEMAGDPKAKEAWMELSDEYPSNIVVHETAINAFSVKSDGVMLDKLIERLKKITGPEGLSWRIARARWLMDKPKATTEESQAAAKILSDVLKVAPTFTDAHYYLALCLEKLGDMKNAIDHMTSAYRGQMGTNQPALDLVRMLQSINEMEKSNSILNDLIQRRKMSPNDREGVIRSLVNALRFNDVLGEIAKQPNREPDLFQAMVLEQENRYPEAKELTLKLLDKNPDSSIVIFASDLFATHKDSKLALDALAKLDSMKLTPGLKELIRGNYLSRFGTPADALKEYTAASIAGPDNPICWLSLASFYLRQGKAAEALKVADDGLVHLPTEPALTIIHEQYDLIKSACEIPALFPIVAAIVDSPSERNSIPSVLRACLEGARDRSERGLYEVQSAASRHPMLLPLQFYYIDLATRDGRLKDAAEVADRISRSFPSRSEGPKIATRLYALSSRFPEVINSSKLWRERSARDWSEEGRIFEAFAYLELNQATESLALVKESAEQPNPNSSLKFRENAIQIYATAMSLQRQPDAAYAKLEPYLAIAGPAGLDMRRRWVQNALHFLDEAGQKRAVETIAKYSDPNNDKEQAQIADLWTTMEMRFHQGYIENAKAILERLVSKPSPDPDALNNLGYAEEMQGHFAAAEGYYRRSVQRDSNFAAGANNLARMLLRKTGDAQALDEALGFAKLAVKLRPVAETYDTLSNAQLANRKIDEAIVSMRKVVELLPLDHKYRLALAGMLLDTKRLEEAGSILLRFDPKNPPKEMDDELVRTLEGHIKKLEKLRKLATTKSTSRPTANSRPATKAN